MPEESAAPEQGKAPGPIEISSGGLNPQHAGGLSEANLVKLVKDAGITVLAHWRLPNGYITSRDDEDHGQVLREAVYRHFRPWILCKVPLGLIEIGPRKRVWHIEWTHTPARIIVTNDQVTKGQDHVHAYTPDKVVEYLQALQDEFVRLTLEGPVVGREPIWRKPVYPKVHTLQERLQQIRKMPEVDKPKGIGEYMVDFLQRQADGGWTQANAELAMLRFIRVIENYRDPLDETDRLMYAGIPLDETKRIWGFHRGELHPEKA